MPSASHVRSAVVLTAGLCLISLHAQEPPPQTPDAEFRFKSGVELVNVTATVSDETGRFVPGLRQEDFAVYEDGRLQAVSHFSAERVPVSLGIALDTSGSMAGERIRAARSALDRFLYELLDTADEIFLYRFDDRPVLVQGWTADRQLLGRALGRVVADGTTAMYDAVAQGIRLTATGQHRKKALLLLSDGRDTASLARLRDVKELLRESDALLYAIGLECGTGANRRSQLRPQFQRRGPFPFPLPPSGGRRGWPMPPQRPMPLPAPQGRTWSQGCTDSVDVKALRNMTDDSGGRTEVVHDPSDLDAATAAIADELSQQYYLGYLSSEHKDGRWHTIRVEVRNQQYRIRARRGYIAS
jgi:VWFA-related protein